MLSDQWEDLKLDNEQRNLNIEDLQRFLMKRANAPDAQNQKRFENKAAEKKIDKKMNSNRVGVITESLRITIIRKIRTT